jgi:hypothetical protein
MDIQTLNTTGFLFTSIEIGFTMLEADYGRGLMDAVVLDDGLRVWSMKIDVLPDQKRYGFIAETQLTRAAYLWNFFNASKRAGNMPFWLNHADPGEDARDWLVSFADHKLSYQQLCDKIFGGVGLTLRQRALRDQESPGDAQPVANPDQI